MPDAVIYPPTITTDKDKLFAIYSLIEQMRLEHNRQVNIAASDKKYVGKMRTYIKEQFEPRIIKVLAEQSRLKTAIRKATYTPEQWKNISRLPPDDYHVIYSAMYGNKREEQVKPTLASSPLLAELKAISLDNLKAHSTPDPYEDFVNDYSEYEEGAYLTRATNKVTAAAWPARDTSGWVWRDKGSGHFSGDFEHLFEFMLTTGHSTAVYWSPYMLNNYDGCDSYDDILASRDDINVLIGYNTILYLRIIENGSATDDTWEGTGIPALNQLYCCTIQRDDDGGGSNKGQITLYIREDTHEGELVDTLQVDCSEQNDFQFVYGISSFDLGNNPANYVYGYSQNLDLQEGGEHYDRSGTALLGLLGSGSRGLDLTRSDTALLGLKAIASRSIALTRVKTALLGLKAKGSIAGTEFLRPNATGDETNIPTQYPDSGEHWEKVDDVAADDDSTYVKTTSITWTRDLYNLSASSGVGAINKITLYFRVKGYSNVGYVKGAIKSDSTVTETAVKCPYDDFGNETWGTYSQEWATNPADSQAWEWSDIDAIQIGVAVKGETGIAYAMCTQVYIKVNYSSVTGHYQRIASALLGLLSTGSRTLALGRSDVALLGLKGIGSRTLSLTRLNTALLGLKGIGSRFRGYMRTNTALLGLKTTATKSIALTRSKTALLGLLATGSRTIDIARSGTALLGLKAIGIMSTAGHYIRTGVAYLGLVATGTRSLALSRTKTALLGLKITGSRLLALTRSNTALLGLKGVGSRTIAITRSGVALLGLKAIGLFETAVLKIISARTYTIEVRNGDGDLIAILENAHGIDYRQEINAPHSLRFQIPATDSKVDNVLLANEYWLRDNRTGIVIRKFKLQHKRDTR